MPIELIFALAVVCGIVIGSVFGGFFKSFKLPVRICLVVAAVGALLLLFVQMESF